MFKNEAPLDFSIALNRQAFSDALNTLEEQLGRAALEVHPVINGQKITNSNVYERVDPSNLQVVVSRTVMASAQDALHAIEVSTHFLPRWEAISVEQRATILQKAASLMRKKKFELLALIVREAGKGWKEADGEVCEAIDFCEYYAEESIKVLKEFTTDEIPGELNRYFYQPRGVAVVISPWNFPLAITCGMAVAALVSGNCVLLKPSRQTSRIAYDLCQILWEAGIPKESLHFLPGSGKELGQVFSSSNKVHMFCFTGSREVGLELIEKSSTIPTGQRHIKKVIAELGGKNAIIIDGDADLDEAIKGVLYSAFGYSGQKCSACSRVIICADIYDQFISRFKLACKDLIIGEAKNPAILIGPVIDADSKNKLLAAIEQGKKDATLLLELPVPENGFFVPPSVFVDVPLDSQLWTEELFGPVLSCMKAKNIDHAISLANDSDYALTGGLFSRSPNNITKVKNEFKVGNLYVNRSCTGAIVKRQPFGGFKLSGIGSKAGGPDYLLQFVEPRTYTENTMRRGFSPESQ